MLHDGAVCGIWRLDRDEASAALGVTHGRLTKKAAASVAAEGRRFLRFVAADRDGHEVHLVEG